MPASSCSKVAQKGYFGFTDLPVKPARFYGLTRKTGFTGFTGFYTRFTPVLRVVLRVKRALISGFTGFPPPLRGETRKTESRGSKGA